MEQLNEFEMALHNCNVLSDSLNVEMTSFNEIQSEIVLYMSRTFVPFSLENKDSDPALEELIQKGKNVLSRIKNLIIKIWTAIKELVDKALHLFSGTVRKLKQYQSAIKSNLASDGIRVAASALNTRIECYPKSVMIKRIDAIMNEINMRWTTADGTPNMAERKSLDTIGFHVRNDKGKVSSSYNGAFPHTDTIAGHGYSIIDIFQLVDNSITMFEQFPKYKESMVRQFDAQIKSKYQEVTSASQTAKVILIDRVAYMTMHKTMQYILKSIREIGNQTIALCKAIGI